MRRLWVNLSKQIDWRVYPWRIQQNSQRQKGYNFFLVLVCFTYNNLFTTKWDFDFYYSGRDLSWSNVFTWTQCHSTWKEILSHLFLQEEKASASQLLSGQLKVSFNFILFASTITHSGYIMKFYKDLQGVLYLIKFSV